MYDTFYTMNYHGVYIHAKHDQLQHCEIFTVKDKDFKSLHAAKLYATKCNKEHDAKMTKIFGQKEQTNAVRATI